MPRKRRHKVQLDEVNLLPVMGLMVVLIPMLLLISVFVRVGVINVSAPKIGMGSAEEQQDEEKKPLNLTIGISDKGYTIAATGAVLPGDPQPAEGVVAPAEQGPTIPTSEGGPCDGSDATILCGEGNVCSEQCGDGNICRGKRCLVWDYKALYNRMVEIKEAFPEESMVNLGADDTVHYGTLIATMDAIRRRREQDKYSKADEFDKALFKKDGDGQIVSLFADVVLAVIQ